MENKLIDIIVALDKEKIGNYQATYYSFDNQLLFFRYFTEEDEFQFNVNITEGKFRLIKYGEEFKTNCVHEVIEHIKTLIEEFSAIDTKGGNENE